jgi:hypothetical protein
VMIKKYTHKGWVFGYRNPSPAFTDDVIYCHYADSSSNSALVRYFKDRSPYVLQYDSTETRFRLFSADQTGWPLPEKK